MKEVKKVSKFQFKYLKELLLILAGMILMILLFVVLGKISGVSTEINQLQNEKNEAASTYVIQAIEGTIAQNKNKIEKIDSYFVDDVNIMNFVKEVDLLKNEGLITQFSFVSENTVTDNKTNYEVLPFEIIFSGAKDRVDYALNRVLELPFMIRSVVFEIEKTPEDNNAVIKYGGYLYVNEEFGKNR